MATRNTRNSAPSRILRGESVLFAAREIDTALITVRLDRFERAQQD